MNSSNMGPKKDTKSSKTPGLREASIPTGLEGLSLPDPKLTRAAARASKAIQEIDEPPMSIIFNKPYTDMTKPEDPTPEKTPQTTSLPTSSEDEVDPEPPPMSYDFEQMALEIGDASRDRRTKTYQEPTPSGSQESLKNPELLEIIKQALLCDNSLILGMDGERRGKVIKINLTLADKQHPSRPLFLSTDSSLRPDNTEPPKSRNDNLDFPRGSSQTTRQSDYLKTYLVASRRGSKETVSPSSLGSFEEFDMFIRDGKNVHAFIKKKYMEIYGAFNGAMRAAILLGESISEHPHRAE